MADYSDLINKTIYDFCDDEKIIRKINPMLSKQQYIERSKNVPPIAIAFQFIDLAELTSNEQLKKAVEDQFAKHIKAFFSLRH